MGRKLTLINIILFLLYSHLSLGQYRTKSWNWNTAAYEKFTFTNSAGKMYYRLLSPPNKDPNKKYPLVVVLHGKGEGIGQVCADQHGSNECNILWGGKMHLDSINKYPSYVLFPQTGGGDWTKEEPVKLLIGLLEYMTKTYHIDLDRIYIHGLSAGGQGTWNMLYLYPHLFAGASPMSASGNTEFAPKLKYNPIWTVQGAFDGNPKPSNSLAMMDALRAQGKYALFTLNENLVIQEWPSAKIKDRDPIFTIAPSESHVAWPTLYNSPSWLGWLYNQNKNRIVVVGRTTISPGEMTKLGVSPGFEAYEWSNGATSNEINIKTSGTFRVRYKRKANLISGPLQWSAWSEPVTITVSSNAPVIADAGKDQWIMLPVTSTRLRGYGAGANLTYKWTKISGGVASLGAANTQTCVLTNLQPGSYTFRLTVSDGHGKIVTDDINVHVGSDTGKNTVTSFTLVNAINDQDIREIKNGDVISLSSLPTQSINIRANTDPPMIGSVKILYDGSSKIETGSPYTWFGDTDGAYNAGKLTVGTHTLTGIPYQGADASGTVGVSLTVKFTVVQSGNTKLAAEDEDTLSTPVANTEDSTKVVLYPNPFEDKVNINFAYKQSNVMIYLYDNSGYLIYKQELKTYGDDNYGEFYLNGIQPGMYRLRITSDKISNKVIPIFKR